MMTAQLEVSILAAPVAAIDRRALSQAWYSALRLARPTPFAVASRDRANRCETFVFPSRRLIAPKVQRRDADLPSPKTARSKGSVVAGDGSAKHRSRRRAARIPLAERIEHAFSAPNAHLKRATFAIGRGKARVHVILQTSGEHTTLLALCRPDLRGVVGRALTEARCALAAQGIGIKSACEWPYRPLGG
jgi:hypothetical protein